MGHKGDHRWRPGGPPRMKASNYERTMAVVNPIGRPRKKVPVRKHVLNAVYFLRDMGRCLEFIMAVALGMALIVLAALGAIQVYDHFWR